MEKEKFTKLICIIVPIVILLILLGVFWGPVADGYFSDKTAKKLKIGEIDAGGLTKEELMNRLTEISENSGNIKINWNDAQFEISALDTGMTADNEKTCENAMKAGRESFGSRISAWYKGVSIPFEFSATKKQFKDAVNAVMGEQGLILGNYDIGLSGGNAVITINENSGSPDTDKLFSEIISKYPYFSEPFTLEKGEMKWPTAEEIRDEFNIQAEDAHREGDKIIGHKEGREIDFEALKTALDNKETQFSVPYKIIKPNVYTEQLGEGAFPNLLGKCVTTFNEGAKNRSSNIRLAASKINGYVMNKGDIFSFNGVVGKRTHETGFKDAPVYTGSGVEDGVGGGICQVSSTLYGAVLESNLKIVSRRNHNYTVSYTKPGFDATVSYGTIDFKFQNNFDNPIKIKAEASGGKMIIYIYGTKQNNNTVSLEYKVLGTTPRGVKRVYNPSLKKGAEVVKSAGYDGMKVQNYRHIKDASGNIIKTENLGVSTYITLNKVIEYNDGTGGGNEAPKTEAPKPAAPADVPTAAPVNPTQPTPELDPEISGKAEANVPVTTID